MSSVSLFDAHCYVGRYKTLQPGSFTTVERLLQDMDHFGIDEALVTHTTAREHHPAVGNPLTVETAAISSRLHPCWSFIPSRSGEIAEPGEFIEQMKENGVKVVKLFYNYYMVPLADWAIGDYLAAFEAKHVPVFLDPDIELSTWDSDRFDWDAVDKICSTFPFLPIILQEARYRSSNRLLYKLLEKHPNLRIELSGYWAYRGIEFITREFGANRILFGTRLPLREPGCAVAMVTYAEVSDDDKKKVAGDNLRQLLQEVKL